MRLNDLRCLEARQLAARLRTLLEEIVAAPERRLAEIALDPQTSGGLLIALPERDAPALLEDLHAHGVEAATIVGHATPLQDVSVRLV